MDNGVFMAYYFLCSEVKMNVKNALFSMQEKAFVAILGALESDSDTGCLWVIERLQGVEVGNTSPIAALNTSVQK